MTNHFMLIACIAFTALLSSTTIRAQYQQQLEDAGTHQLLDIQTPQTFNINSPLKQPDSLRSRPYFDFLSTLYRHDTAKQQLFRPYQRTRRAAVDEVLPADNAAVADVPRSPRTRRAIVFRPLFVYKQQEIKKEQLKAKRRRRY